MTELETYIRSHAAEFDTQEPACGHEERFLARLDASRTAAASPLQDFFSSLVGFFRNRRFQVAACALATCVAIVLILRPGDPFRGTGNDPKAIYLAYMDQVAVLYSQLPTEGGTDWDATLEEMTEEADPLFTQLPDELSRRQQARILKDYYGELLTHARKLKNIR